jgi:hypothetical protein
MIRRSGVAAVLVSIPLFAAPGFAQQPASPPDKTGSEESLELKQTAPVPPRLPVIRPEPQSKEAIGEAGKSVEELQRQQRDEQRLREAQPRPPSRPDLDESVRSGIQGREIQKALPQP